MSGLARFTPWGLAAVATLLFVGLVLYASPDFRGDDQYWYLADTETLLAGGEPLSNNLYPAQILGPAANRPPYFLHHILCNYLVLPAAWAAGAFYGWLLTNLAASWLTAVLAGVLVWRFCGTRIALLAYSTFLVLPLTIRQTSQINAEAMIAFWAVLGTVLYVFAGQRRWCWVLLWLVAAAAFYCRVSFLPILFLVPVAYIWQHRGSPAGPARWIALVAGVWLLSVLAMLIQPRWFPEAVANDMAGILNTAIPGQTDNMYGYFQVDPLPVTTGQLAHKFAANLLWQAWPVSWKWLIFYLPYNLCILACLLGWFGRICPSPPSRRLIQAALVLFGLHLATVLLTQNTFRYLMPSMPPLVAVATVVFITLRLPARWAGAAWAAGLLLLLVADGVVVQSLRQKALREGWVRNTLQAVIDANLPAGQTVLVEAVTNEFPLWGYVLRPRRAVFVRPQYTAAQYDRLRRASGADWLICREDSPLRQHYAAEGEPSWHFRPAPYDKYVLLHLAEP
ncbi:MAG: hypothetical protein JW810_12615 [Sedimentisphaerales bacterium]|nr:hypothetical protein [Sedimentisphaerales bacterium]